MQQVTFIKGPHAGRSVAMAEKQAQQLALIGLIRIGGPTTYSRRDMVAESAAETGPPKRKRGRPRKNAVVA